MISSRFYTYSRWVTHVISKKSPSRQVSTDDRVGGDVWPPRVRQAYSIARGESTTNREMTDTTTMPHQPNSITAILNNLFQSKAKGIKVEELSVDDVVVAVLGPTGSGKSSFIELATGIGGIVGHGLESFTNDISVIKLSFPGLNLCFVDTPGFDDTNKSDLDILKLISDWLSTTYNQHIRLAGLLYFHRISDNRMAGTPLKNFHLFEKLCGDEFDRIVLTTTMWDEVDEEVGVEREQELKAIYWKSMVERGSYVNRFLYTRESALEILAPVFEEVHKRSSLLLQKEINDLGLLLKETSAGKTLSAELQELVSQHQVILERIRNELKDLTPEHDLQYLMEEYQKVSAELQRSSEDLRAMKVSLADRIRKLVTIVDWSKIFSRSGLLFWQKKKADIVCPWNEKGKMDNEKWEEESSKAEANLEKRPRGREKRNGDVDELESKPDEAEVGGSGKEAGAGVENMVGTGDAEVGRQNEGEANVLG